MRFWLVPGMGVKRHVGVAVLGAFLVVAGLGGLLFWVLQDNAQALGAPVATFLLSPTWEHFGGWGSLLTALVGLGVAVAALGSLNRSLLAHWMPQPREAAAVLHRRLSLARGPRIVAFGGGTGLSNLLRGLREHSSNLTAVVAVSDDGGSSGRLRDAFGMPAPGDLSDCLAALSDHESQVSRLLEYRFERGGELAGHTFGNLIITTLTEVEGDFAEAIRALNRLLNLTGTVYPMTAEPVSLRVVKRSGEEVAGESRVREVGGASQRVRLEPPRPAALREILRAVADADLVVLGPGSLFTSTLPPLLVPETRRALLRTEAPLVYVCNIMTEAGETDGFSAWDHIEHLRAHLGRYPDWVVVNARPVDEARRARYREEGAEVVAWDEEFFARAGVKVAHLDLLSDGPHAQHDSAELARWLVRCAQTAHTQTRTRARTDSLETA